MVWTNLLQRSIGSTTGLGSEINQNRKATAGELVAELGFEVNSVSRQDCLIGRVVFTISRV